MELLRFSLLFFIAFVGMNAASKAQELIGFSVRYADTFRDWDVFPAAEELDLGELTLSWPYRSPWIDYDYEIGDRIGSIRQKWLNQKHQWELVDGDYVVMIKNQWKDDLTIWKIQCDDYTLTFECRYTNIADEWTLRTQEYGHFEIYTEYEGDPRDWIIEDGLDEEVPMAVKMAMIFVSIYYSTPHN